MWSVEATIVLKESWKLFLEFVFIMIRNRVRVGQNLSFRRAYGLFDGYFKVIRYMNDVMLAFEWVMIRIRQTFRWFCDLEIWKRFHFDIEFGFLFRLCTRRDTRSWAIVFRMWLYPWGSGVLGLCVPYHKNQFARYCDYYLLNLSILCIKW